MRFLKRGFITVNALRDVLQEANCAEKSLHKFGVLRCDVFYATSSDQKCPPSVISYDISKLVKENANVCAVRTVPFRKLV